MVTNADLRSWLSLPSEVQAAQLALPPGSSDLTLASPFGWTEHLPVEVTPGSTTFITVRAVQGFKSITSTTFSAGDGTAN